MIRELAQRLLKLLQRVTAARQPVCRQNRGEDFQGVPQLLPLDPQPVDVGRVPQFPVRSGKEAVEEPTEPPSPVAAKVFPGVGRLDIIEQFLNPARPTRCPQLVPDRLNGLARYLPASREHGHQSVTGPTCLPVSAEATIAGLPRQPAGEDIQIPGVASGPADLPQPLLEPEPLFRRQEPAERGQSRQGSPGRHPQAVNPFGIVPRAAGRRQV